MKKNIIKVTLAVTVLLTGFLNSASFSKVFSFDVDLNGLFSMAVAEGECTQSSSTSTDTSTEFGMRLAGGGNRTTSTVVDGDGCYTSTDCFTTSCETGYSPDVCTSTTTCTVTTG